MLSYLLTLILLLSSGILSSQCEANVEILIDEENVEIVPFNVDSCTINIPYALTNSGTCDLGQIAIDITVKRQLFIDEVQIDTLTAGLATMATSNESSSFTSDILMMANGMCIDTMNIRYELTISTATPPMVLTEPIPCPGGVGTMEVCASDNTIICNMDECPVPIQLVEFSGRIQNGSAHLFWSTMSEINNDHFIIAHSNDLNVFSEVGKIDGSGNSLHLNEYDFVHSNIPSGTNYYKLIQVDLDGTRFESDILVLENKRSRFTIVPNPVSDIVNLQFEYPSSSDNNIRLFNVQGQLLVRESVNSGAQNFELNLSQFPTGIYLLEYVDAGQRYQKRLVKK